MRPCEVMTAAGLTSEPVPAVVGIATSWIDVLRVGIAGHPLASVEERQRQLAYRQLGVLGQQPHHLGRIHHRAAADGHDEVGTHVRDELDPGPDDLLVRLGQHVGEDPDVTGIEVTANLVDGTALTTLNSSLTMTAVVVSMVRRLSRAPTLK